MLLSAFYNHIHVIGAERIPEEGPLIFVLNHTNGTVDAQLLQRITKQHNVHQLGKSPLFELPILGSMFSAIGGIPVYRREDFQGAKQDHNQMFSAVYEAFEAGESIGLCPEGTSHDSPHLLPLKIGVSLMAFGALERGIPIRVVPVGATFFAKEKFRSEVVMEIGEPFFIPLELELMYMDNLQESRNPAHSALLELIAERMRAVSLNLPNWKTFDRIRTARRLFLPSNMKLSYDEYTEINRVFDDYFAGSESNKFAAVESDIADYLEDLDGRKLSDYHIREGRLNWFVALFALVWRIMLCGIFIPVVCPALVINMPMHIVAKCLAGCAAKSEIKTTIAKGFQDEGYEGHDVVASYRIIALLFLVPLFYAGYSTAVSYFATLQVSVLGDDLFLKIIEGFVWFLLSMCLLLGISYASLSILDRIITILRSIRTIVYISFLTSSRTISTLQYRRDELQQQIRQLVGEVSSTHKDPIVLKILQAIEDTAEERTTCGWSHSKVFGVNRRASSTLTRNPLKAALINIVMHSEDNEEEKYDENEHLLS